MGRLPLPLEAGRVRLRLPSAGDVRPWHRILIAPELREARPYGDPWTVARVRAKVAKARIEAGQGTGYELVVEDPVAHTVIGRVALKRLQLGNERRAELAIWMDPGVWGQGLAAEAASLLCRAGFRNLGLHRIDAEVLAFNSRSIRLLKAVGFRREGERREAFFHRGRWISSIQFGLLRSDLREPRGTARTVLGRERA
jgi:[ribosomal protein S5]-alanine N-acetyltransferase